MKYFFLLLFIFSSCAGVTGTGNPCVGTDCLENPAGEGVPGYSNTAFGISFHIYGWQATELGTTSEAALNHNGTESVLTVNLSADSVSTMTVKARQLNTSAELTSLLQTLYPDVQLNASSGNQLQGYWLVDPQSSERIYFFLAQQNLVSMQVHVLDADGVYESVIASLKIE